MSAAALYAVYLGRRRGLVGLGLSLLCTLGVGHAQSPQPPQPLTVGTPVGAAAAAQWLARVRQAADNSSYQGTLMFSTGGVVSSTRVLHYCDGKQRYEKAEVLDGRARLRYRHNDELVTVWPASKVAVVESRDGMAEFPGLPDAPGLNLLDSYDIHPGGADRIAGHAAQVVLLKPRDGHRYAQRLWTDKDSGLLLRGDVLGAQGEVLETSAFSDFQRVPKPQPDAVLLPMKRLDGLRVVQARAVKTQLETEGWRLTGAVPGFQLVSCTKRALDAASDGPTQQVLQSVFSDGLASVSVFVEPYDAQRHKQAMRTLLGATHTLMHRRGDWWITVVGEVPLATVQQIDAAFERLPR